MAGIYTQPACLWGTQLRSTRHQPHKRSSFRLFLGSSKQSDHLNQEEISAGFLESKSLINHRKTYTRICAFRLAERQRTDYQLRRIHTPDDSATCLASRHDSSR